tara:strand:- start:545 stop:2278 length:1734 start_codon:yes stop_codon:yes gene_type:complete
MKVPLYDELPRRQTGGTGSGLSVQASPQALVGSNTLGNLGDALVEFGFEKARIKNESQAAEAITAAQQEMQQLIDDTDRKPVGSVDEGAVLNGLDRIVNKYAAGAAENPQTGRFFLETKTSRQLFQTAVQKSLAKYKLGFRQSHGEKVLQVAKEGAYRQVIDTTNEIIEMTDQSDAMFAVDSLLSTEPGLIDGETKYSGLIPDALAKGYFNVDESIQISSSALSNIVSGRVRKRFLDSKGNTILDPENIVQQLRARTLEDQVTLYAFNQLSENERAALLTNLLNEASQLENEQFEREAAEEAQAAKDLAEKKKLIVNHDRQDPQSRAEAKKVLNQILAEEGFESIKERENYERLLGMGGDSESLETNREAYTQLTRLDANNQLTLEAINGLSSELSESDFQYFMGKFVQETNDARRNAEDIIRQSVNFDVASLPGSGEIAGIKTRLASEQVVALEKWLRTEPKPGFPNSGGLGKNYQEVAEYAEGLADKTEKQVLKIVQAKFEEYAKNFAAQIPKILGSKFASIKLDLTTGNKRQAILDYLAAIKQEPGGEAILTQPRLSSQIEQFFQDFASEEGLR